jgi:hypothetical protein
MQRDEIKNIIAKYRKKALSTHDEEKSWQIERFAIYLEENITLFEEASYETEGDLIDDFKEAEADMDAQWDAMFPNG